MLCDDERLKNAGMSAVIKVVMEHSSSETVLAR